MIEVKPEPNSCRLHLTNVPHIGGILLWLPEGVMSNTGSSSIYPTGPAWKQDGNRWSHSVTEKDLFGPGNAPHVDETTIECCGIRFPEDSPVCWESVLEVDEASAEFSIHLTNTGNKTIHKASAAVCVRFLKADWWSDDTTFVLSEGRVRPLAELGRDAGQPNGFQAYLVKGQTYDHVFYHEFWGINRHTVDRPAFVSENRQAGVSIQVSAERAYFIHSNKGNPCTDLMLAFGDLEPGKSAVAKGRIRVREGLGLEFDC